ncbi:hypothetical protein Hanom_Chr13g01197991 [Helianthus anomalus]
MKRHWNITVKVFGHLHMVEDEQGNNYNFSYLCAAQGGAHDEETVDEEDEPSLPVHGDQSRDICGQFGKFLKKWPIL